MIVELFTEPKDNHVYVLLTDNGEYTLVKKMIYRSGKGEYIRVPVGPNQHQRVYLEEIGYYVQNTD